MTEEQFIQLLQAVATQDQVLTAIDFKLQVIIALILVFIIVMVCRYVYKFFNMFFK